MNRLSLNVLAVTLAVAATASAEPLAAGGGYYASDDSEGFRSRRTIVDGMAGYSSLENRTGVRYVDYAFSQDSWSRRGEQLRFVANRIDRRTADGWNFEAGVFRQAAHELAMLDASYRKTLPSGIAFETFASRDFVETRNALDNGVHFNFAGASADLPLSQKLTMVGMFGLQSFSDNNDRRHARARLIFQPLPDLGLTLQARYRYYDNSRTGGPNYYFNPERYQEGMLALGLRQRFGHWRTALTAGIGQQQVVNDPWSETRLLEASAEKQVAGYGVRLRSGYSRAAAAATASNDPAYSYRYVIGELMVPF